MAHDGSDWGMAEQARNTAQPLPDRLVARCLATNCGAESAVDVADWLEAGQGLPLRTFESRLRCACGARRVRLEPARGELPPVNRAIYRFR